MGIGNYPGHIYMINEDIIEKHCPEEWEQFNSLIEKHHITLGQFVNGLDTGDTTQCFDAMDIEFTTPDGEPLPFLSEITDDEYESKVFDDVVAAINSVADKFKEVTGVEIELWCPLAQDHGTSEDLDLDEPYWSMSDPVQFKPEVEALGIDMWGSFRSYVLTC